MMHAFVLGLLLAVIPPAPTDYVTDSAHALSSSTKQNLETELRAFNAKTGDQILVWIGESTDGEPLENWTVDAAEKWKVGRKGLDNGAVLFVFMRDRRTRIEVGYGLEPVLTDAKSANILEQMTPRMRSGDVDGAISGAVDEILTVVDPTYAVPSPQATAESSDSSDTVAGLVIFGIFLVIVVGLIVAIVVTIARRGKRHGDWLDSWMFVGPMGMGGGGGSFFGGGGSWGGGVGGFSGGGGGFGGGGASGGW